MGFHFNNGGLACSAEKFVNNSVQKISVLVGSVFVGVEENIVDVLHAGLAISGYRDVSQRVNGVDCVADGSCFSSKACI